MSGRFRPLQEVSYTHGQGRRIFESRGSKLHAWLSNVKTAVVVVGAKLIAHFFLAECRHRQGRHTRPDEGACAQCTAYISPSDVNIASDNGLFNCPC